MSPFFCTTTRSLHQEPAAKAHRDANGGGNGDAGTDAAREGAPGGLRRPMVTTPFLMRMVGAILPSAGLWKSLGKKKIGVADSASSLVVAPRVHKHTPIHTQRHAKYFLAKTPHFPWGDVRRAAKSPQSYRSIMGPFVKVLGQGPKETQYHTKDGAGGKCDGKLFEKPPHPVAKLSSPNC